MFNRSRLERNDRLGMTGRDGTISGAPFVRRRGPVLFVTPAITGTALLALPRSAVHDPVTPEQRAA